jgi:uncharacterized coiled-coil DUF342 family protein
MSTAEQRQEWRRHAEYTRDHTSDKVDRGAALRELALLADVDRLMQRNSELNQEWQTYTARNMHLRGQVEVLERTVAVVTAERDALAAELAQVRAEVNRNELNQRIRKASDARSAGLRYALEQYEAYFSAHHTNVPNEIASLANKALAAYDFDDVVLGTELPPSPP